MFSEINSFNSQKELHSILSESILNNSFARVPMVLELYS